jgi:hypothetical protein
MIHANCRMRLTADDFTFVVKVLSKSETDQVSLVKLLIDEDTRDAILDHELLTKAILESPQRLPISPQLLFYVLCRKVLRETPVKSRDAADFVASVLEGFMRTMPAPGRRSCCVRTRRTMHFLLAVSLRTTSRCGRVSAGHPTFLFTRPLVR